MTTSVVECFDLRVLDLLSEGIWIADAGHVLRYVNPAMTRIAGVSAETMLGRSVFDFPLETIQFFRDDYLTAIDTRTPHAYTCPVRTPAGRETWQAGWLTPLVDGGEWLGILCTVQDTTARKAMEDELRLERDFTDQLIATAQVIVMVLAPQGHVLRINPYMERLCGYTQAEVLGCDWFDTFLPATTRESTRRLFRKAVGDISTRGNIDVMLARDGREILVEWYDWPLRNTQGEVIGLVCIGLDIQSGERRARDVVALTEERRAILDSDLIGVARINDRVIVWCNRCAANLYGYTPEELIGQSTRMLYPDDATYAAVGRELYAAIAQGGGYVRQRMAHVHKDGSRATLLLTIHAFTAGAQDIIVLFSDVSESVRLEEELGSARLHLDLALEGADLALWEHDFASGRVIFNARWFKMLGWRPEDISPDMPGWLALLHPEDRPRFDLAFAEHLRGDSPGILVEFRLQHAQGHWLWIEGRGRVVERDAEGNPLRAAGTHLDISERKRLAHEGVGLLHQIETLLGGLDRRPASADFSAGGGAEPEREPLSRRQEQIMRLVAGGLTSSEIADRLNISAATVTTHRRDLMRKLGLRNVAELTRHALQRFPSAGAPLRRAVKNTRK